MSSISCMSKNATKPSVHDYEKYGSKTYFDEYGNIFKIEQGNGETSCPGDEYWEWATLLSRTSMFMKTVFIRVGRLHNAWGILSSHCVAKILINESSNPPFVHIFTSLHNPRCKRSGIIFIGRQKKCLLRRGLSFDDDGGLK